MVRNTDHRVTARSMKVGAPWYDRRGREWQQYTCGVTLHGECPHVINYPTGRRGWT